MEKLLSLLDRGAEDANLVSNAALRNMLVMRYGTAMLQERVLGNRRPSSGPETFRGDFESTIRTVSTYKDLEDLVNAISKWINKGGDPDTSDVSQTVKDILNDLLSDSTFRRYFKSNTPLDISEIYYTDYLTYGPAKMDEAAFTRLINPMPVYKKRLYILARHKARLYEEKERMLQNIRLPPPPAPAPAAAVVATPQLQLRKPEQPRQQQSRSLVDRVVTYSVAYISLLAVAAVVLFYVSAWSEYASYSTEVSNLKSEDTGFTPSNAFKRAKLEKDYYHKSLKSRIAAETATTMLDLVPGVQAAVRQFKLHSHNQRFRDASYHMMENNHMFLEGVFRSTACFFVKRCMTESMWNEATSSLIREQDKHMDRLLHKFVNLASQIEFLTEGVNGSVRFRGHDLHEAVSKIFGSLSITANNLSPPQVVDAIRHSLFFNTFEQLVGELQELVNNAQSDRFAMISDGVLTRAIEVVLLLTRYDRLIYYNGDYVFHPVADKMEEIGVGDMKTIAPHYIPGLKQYYELGFLKPRVMSLTDPQALRIESFRHKSNRF